MRRDTVDDALRSVPAAISSLEASTALASARGCRSS